MSFIALGFLVRSIFGSFVSPTTEPPAVQEIPQNASSDAHESAHTAGMIPLRPNWDVSSAPSFCQPLLKKPRAADNCAKNQFTGQCNQGEPHFLSVDLQDYYVYTRHFKHLHRRGSYIDIATNNPITGSNTFIFDVCLGWEGVCVEANPTYLDRIRIVRNCHIVPTCVSDEDGQKVSFALAGGVGGILETNKHAANWKKNHVERQMMNLTCRSMASVQREKQMREVDFLSLDVEGHELNVLKGFEWDELKINVITVEISTDTLADIEAFLNKRGYARHHVHLTEYPNKPNHKNTTGALFQDAIFLHNSVTWGQPQ